MKVSIVDCEDYNQEKVYNSVRKAINDIGFDVKKNQKVLIKPNVLGQHTPEECVTTHPAVIEALIRIFQENECKVIIGESSGWYKEGGTNKALEISGLMKAGEKYNVPVINLETRPIKKDCTGMTYKQPEISELIFDADLVVNAPKLKTHTLMKYTGAVKNLFGTVPGGRKQRLHAFAQKPEKFAQVLVDIYQSIKPGLTIMDGICGIEGNGPGSTGIRKQTGIILASENGAALDIVASEIIGYKPMEILTNAYCVKRGLVKQEEIEIIGNKRIIPYKKPVNVSKMPSWMISWVMSQACMLPYAIKEKCTKCGKCAEICPMGAIKLRPYPKIDRNKCISCYCCHEMCPYGAMDLRGSKLVRILRKIKNTVMMPFKR